jgi:hypothetical protein
MKDGADFGGREPEPAAVGGDDRAANRQSHAHAFRLCGEERLEQAIANRAIDAAVPILDFHEG